MLRGSSATPTSVRDEILRPYKGDSVEDVEDRVDIPAELPGDERLREQGPNERSSARAAMSVVTREVHLARSMLPLCHHHPRRSLYPIALDTQSSNLP